MTEEFKATEPVTSDKQNLAILSLAFGVLGLFFSCGGLVIPICCYPFAFIFGILGVVFGIIGLQSDQRTLAIIGIVISGLCLLSPIFFLLIRFLGIGLGMMSFRINELFNPTYLHNFGPFENFNNFHPWN